MLALILLVATLFCLVTADRNITLDDTDSAIAYSGDWLSTPYDGSNAGGTHQVTATSEAFATLTFTGIAIYFYSPLWPFRVTTAVSLDGQPSELLDLRDYDSPFLQDGPETASSQVVWWADGLQNMAHTLKVMVGSGEDLAILDQLIYTVKDSNSTAPTTSLHHHRPSVSRSAPVPSGTQGAASTSSSSKNNKVALSVILSIVCSLFGIISLWAIYWYWQRRKRRNAEGTAQDANDPEMSETTSRRYPRTTGLTAAGRSTSGLASGSGSLRSKWGRRPAPLPPRSKNRAGGPNPGMRAHKTLSTIPETSGDGDTLKQTLSISEAAEGQDSQDSQESHESATLSSPSSLLAHEQREERTDPNISLSPTKPSIRLVTDNR